VPAIDIVVDDGGHEPEQQTVTLEETLPLLRPGGVYVCEDVHGLASPFTFFAMGLVDELNRFARTGDEAQPSPWQQAVYSIHFYPYVLVIERRREAPEKFVAPRNGTEWQPFL
jgi:hypothetical protein